MSDWPVKSSSSIKYVNEVLESGILTNKHSAFVQENSYQERFSKEFNKFLGVEYGCLAPNGTIALVIALLSVGVKENDYVLVSENTWVSSITSISLINAIPVLVKCNKETLLIDTKSFLKLEKKYKPKAAIIVHLNGFMQDYSTIINTCKKKRIKLIEDCAQAIGSEYKEKKAGTFGDVAAFSFQESKVLTSGEGGYICTNNPKVFRNICLYQDLNYIKKVPLKENLMYLFGSNYRVTEYMAAFLYGQYKEVFLPSLKQKSEWAIKFTELINNQSTAKSVQLDKAQTIFSAYKIPIVFNNENDLKKFENFLTQNNMLFYSGTKPLYLTTLLSTGRKKLKRMKYKTTFVDDYQTQINQVGIFHYYLNEKTYNLLKNYFDAEANNGKKD